MLCNFEDEVAGWEDWDFAMEYHEFCEALARLAVTRVRPPPSASAVARAFMTETKQSFTCAPEAAQTLPRRTHTARTTADLCTFRYSSCGTRAWMEDANGSKPQKTPAWK